MKNLFALLLCLIASTSHARDQANELIHLGNELKDISSQLSEKEHTEIAKAIDRLSAIIYKNRVPCVGLQGSSYGRPLFATKEEASGLGNAVAYLRTGTQLEFLGGTHRNIYQNPNNGSGTAGYFAISVRVLSSEQAGMVGWTRLEYTDFSILCPDLETYFERQFAFP